MEKRWHIHRPDTDSTHRLCRVLGCDPVIATVLANRGIRSEDDARQFLNPSLSSIRPPFVLKDLDIAARRIHRAIVDREPIMIFGDYDADGVTATAMMIEFLEYAGADVSYYIPHRISDGYGLKPHHILTHALPNHFRLIITVDCGISSHEAVQTARNNGIDVIITDHHQVPDVLPPALAAINPARSECTDGFQHLAGVGVAFYLLIHLRKYLREHHFWKDRAEPNLAHFCDLVALGTVADMVPLLRENRAFTQIGIQCLTRGRRPGITALLATCGLRNQPPEAEDIAFRLAPRINAAGRLAHAETAVELLTARDDRTARNLAARLNDLNAVRQEKETETFESIRSFLGSRPHLLKGHGIVLAHPQWHEGILGIIASRLMNAYFRPVVLIATRDGIGKGSARSIPGIDLYGILKKCDVFLDAFGGHATAAGLTLSAENIDTFRTAFDAAIAASSKPEDFVPQVAIDAELQLVDISPELIDQIETLKPFGSANSEPLFMARKVSVVSSKIVGENHRKMQLQQTGGKPHPPLSAIHFNIDRRLPMKDAFDRLAFRLRWNRWNGKKTAQMIVEEI